MRKLRSGRRGMASGASLLFLSLVASLPAGAAEMPPMPRSLGLANIGQVSLPSSSAASVPRSKRPAALRPALRPFSVHDGFYDAYLVPKMSARLHGENVAAASDFADPRANPWTRNVEAADRVEHRALRAAKGAFKSYALERLGVDRWSIPLVGRGGDGGPSSDSEPRGVRVSLGVSHLAPRADVRIPAGTSNLVLSADVRGHYAATFEPASSRVRVAADFDARDRSAAVRMSLRF